MAPPRPRKESSACARGPPSGAQPPPQYPPHPAPSLLQEGRQEGRQAQQAQQAPRAQRAQQAQRAVEAAQKAATQAQHAGVQAAQEAAQEAQFARAPSPAPQPAVSRLHCCRSLALPPHAGRFLVAAVTSRAPCRVSRRRPRWRMRCGRAPRGRAWPRRAEPWAKGPRKCWLTAWCRRCAWRRWRGVRHGMRCALRQRSHQRHRRRHLCHRRRLCHHRVRCRLYQR